MTHTRQIELLSGQLNLTNHATLAEQPPGELHLQQLWFEHQLPRLLTTLGGQHIEILHTGFWNHGPGPDFRDALILLTEENRTLAGDIEIHTHAADWQQHGHHTDPAYARVILHIALHGTEPAMHRDIGSLPCVELYPQLDEETRSLLNQPQPPPPAPLPNARPGRCASALAQLSTAQIRDTLHRAGLLRLHRKARALALQRRRDGDGQTLWEALATALGYSENKTPFRLLARAVPHKHAAGADLLQRDALLFGASGFLPRDQIQTLPSDSRAYINRLWHAWWAHPLSTETVPVGELCPWKLAPVRPANHPHRRIAALSALAPLIPRLLAALQRGAAAEAADLIANIGHPHFDTHYHLSSPARETMPALVGNTRASQMLWNVLLPWTLPPTGLSDTAPLLKQPAEPQNARTRTAIQRLFPQGKPPLRLDGLARQGLITVLDELCARAGDDCRGCPWPAALRASMNGST